MKIIKKKKNQIISGLSETKSFKDRLKVNGTTQQSKSGKSNKNRKRRENKGEER